MGKNTKKKEVETPKATTPAGVVPQPPVVGTDNLQGNTTPPVTTPDAGNPPSDDLVPENKAGKKSKVKIVLICDVYHGDKLLKEGDEFELDHEELEKFSESFYKKV